jgi:hypothetical protein
VKLLICWEFYLGSQEHFKTNVTSCQIGATFVSLLQSDEHRENRVIGPGPSTEACINLENSIQR